MNIRLSDGYILRSDERQIILSKEDKKGNISPVSFHKDVYSALEAFLNKKVYASEAESIKELMREIRETRKQIKEWIKEAENNGST